MKFISTRDVTYQQDFETALFHGLAPDGGLYIPSEFPHLSTDILQAKEITLPQLGYAIMAAFLAEIPDTDLQRIINNALNFAIPLVPLYDNLFLLEVFHGPTLAFKDVGARFMANMLSYFLLKKQARVSILVATSGDTGSAIAHAFHRIPAVDVYILYPSKKITRLQEQQMTTLGDNIHAIEILGTFDDCQKLVKSALLDTALKEKKSLSTANSINISRLLPQIIYHSFGMVQLKQMGNDLAPLLSVPSGNFGNLTSALYAERIGFPVKHIIAATNANAIVPHYLKTGVFTPSPSKQTFSNAMDVGNPSNFERLLAFYHNDYQQISTAITGVSISDDATLAEIQTTYKKTGYILDPHAAVGVAAAKLASQNKTDPIIVTATAHPAKFPEVIRRALQFDIDIPESLQAAMDKPKQAILMEPNMDTFRQLLLNKSDVRA